VDCEAIAKISIALIMEQNLMVQFNPDLRLPQLLGVSVFKEERRSLFPFPSTCYSAKGEILTPITRNLVR
jgi:hypothetical protein